MQNKLRLAKANSLFRFGKYESALNEYQRFSMEHPGLARFVQANIKLSETRLKRLRNIAAPSSQRPLVSVIIPVHNVQAYIRQCLDSVLNQTLKNIEVIVVDDGSKDDSPKILKEYAERDPRIIYIRNSSASGNSGTPRNQALGRATGEYVAFVDSDDWIDPEMLATMHNEAILSGSDIVSSSGFYRETSDGETEQVNVAHNLYDPEFDTRDTLFLGHHFTIAWYRIYRLDFINREKIQFGETTTSADVPFTIKSLLLTNKVTGVDGIYYHYRFDRPESTIHRRKGRGAFELFRSYSALLNNLTTIEATATYVPHIILKALGDYAYNLRFLASEMQPEFKATMQAFLVKYGKPAINHPAFNKYWNGLLVSLLQDPDERTLDEILKSGKRNGPAISIIIPAHNVEKYIHRSVNSVLSQSMVDIEVLIVNDGSTDQTLRFIEEIAATDSRIILISINKPSGNPGTPRNIAICKAKGDFIGFVDADDWVETDMFEKLVERARVTESDICSASAFYRHESDTVKELKIGYRTISSADRNNKQAFSSGFFSNIWNRIYRKDLLKLHGLYFPRIYLAEDFCFSAACHAFATRTCLVEGAYYHYDYSRPNSTTDLRTGTKGFAIIDDFQLMFDYFESLGLYEEFADEIVKKKLNSLLYTYERLNPDLRPNFKQKCTELMAPLMEKLDTSTLSQDELARFSLIIR